MNLPQRAAYEMSLYLMRTAHWCRLWVRRMSGDTRAVHGVRVLLDNGHGEVLLVRHWYAPGVWTLPGGGIHRNENVEDAAVRELHEETGYTAQGISGKIGTYSGSRADDHVVAVYITSYSGSLRLLPDVEIIERGFFRMQELPENISPANRRRVEEYCAGVRNSVGTRW
ncbi:MAG: NUDIX domain-containing protein [Candidatus Pacebacteria bacterium]|nr:NUDIX domain-containing protein [Candidatus Paceibacterota bacterium]